MTKKKFISKIVKFPQIKNLKESFFLLKEAPFYIVVPALIDLMFLLIVGFIGSFLTQKALPHLEQIAVIQQEGLSLSETVASGDAAAFVANKMELAGVLTKVIAIFAEVLLVAFVLWMLFQGFNWMLAAKCVNKKKINLKNHWINFSIISILWLILSGTSVLLFVNLSANILLSQNSIISLPVAKFLTIVAVGLFSYLSFIGYAISYKYKLRGFFKNIYRIGFKEIKKTILTFVIIIIMFLIIDQIVTLFSKFGIAGTLISGMFLVLPLIAYARVYLVKNL